MRIGNSFQADQALKPDFIKNFINHPQARLISGIALTSLLPLSAAMCWLAGASVFVSAVSVIGTCAVVAVAESILFDRAFKTEPPKEPTEAVAVHSALRPPSDEETSYDFLERILDLVEDAINR